MTRISFKIDTASGEASVTPESERLLEQMTRENPVLACDLLKDIRDIAQSKYDVAREAAFPGARHD